MRAGNMFGAKKKWHQKTKVGEKGVAVEKKRGKKETNNRRGEEGKQKRKYRGTVRVGGGANRLFRLFNGRSRRGEPSWGGSWTWKERRAELVS